MKEYFKLIRWQTLFFLALTQFLVKYGIVAGLVTARSAFFTINDPAFLLMVPATVLLAAAGFAINDYFDVKSDLLTRPAKVMVDVKIPRNRVIIVHSLFNILGVSAGVAASFIAGKPSYSLIFILVSMFLFIYSARLRKRNNGSALMIAVFPFIAIELVWLFQSRIFSDLTSENHLIISRFVAFYGFFAFLATLVLEYIKQLQNIDVSLRESGSFVKQIGEKKGLILIFSLLFLSSGLLISAGPVLLYPGYRVTMTTLAISLILMAMAMFRLPVAFEKKDYSSITLLVKAAMFAGVLSMLTINF